MLQTARLTVTPTTAQIEPGGRATLILTVVNASQVVDRFQVACSGVPTTWYAIDKPVVALFPGATERVLLSLHPPAGLGIAAGAYPITVTVTSESEPGVQTSTVVTLQVGVVGACGWR